LLPKTPKPRLKKDLRKINGKSVALIVRKLLLEALGKSP